MEKDSFNMMNNSSQELIGNIRARLKGMGKRVMERVTGVIVPNIERLGPTGKRWLSGIQNDFSTLVDDPNDEIGAGNYEGWSSNDIRQLYYVLYGEEIDDEGFNTEQGENTDDDRGSDDYDLAYYPDYVNFQKIIVTEFDETKPWRPPLKVLLTAEDGTNIEVPASRTLYAIARVQNKEMQILNISVAAAGHIDSLHIKNEDFGSNFDYPSFDALVKGIYTKIPDSVFLEEGKSAFAIDTGKNMGKEGIANIDELMQLGVIQPRDLQLLVFNKEDIFRLNREGTLGEKEIFVQEFNKKEPGNPIKLKIIRNGVIIPSVVAQKVNTTKLFMVFGPDEKGRKTLYTMAPGRYMPSHPIPSQHMNMDGSINEKTFSESLEAWFNTFMLVEK